MMRQRGSPLDENSLLLPLELSKTLYRSYVVTWIAIRNFLRIIRAARCGERENLAPTYFRPEHVCLNKIQRGSWKKKRNGGEVMGRRQRTNIMTNLSSLSVASFRAPASPTADQLSRTSRHPHRPGRVRGSPPAHHLLPRAFRVRRRSRGTRSCGGRR